MSKPELIIRGGNIVDGTGRGAFRGDVAIAGDRIVAVGHVPEVEGAKVVDATGKVVAPGFIELHTHYDPQLCWDRRATPAAEHGVTTVVAGGCSLSLAPMKPHLRQKATDCFYKIEDLRNEFFDVAVPYSWESFGEFLDFIRPGLGVNVAPVVGHSMLRLYVMGADAQKRHATIAERETMAAILRESLQAGGVGMSSCYDHLHDENDDPMPAAYADREERLALARVCAEEGRPWAQYAIHPTDGRIRAEELNEMGELARESGGSFSANGLFVLPGTDQWRRDLDYMESKRSEWGRLSMQTLIRPLDQWYQLSRAWNVLNVSASWAAIMLLPLDERIEAFRKARTDKALRERLQAETLAGGVEKQVSNSTVLEVVSEANRAYVGRKLIDIAQEEGRSYTDVLIDIAAGDDLGTTFVLNNYLHADPVDVPYVLTHPSIHIGGSDAGAHIYQMAGEGDSSFMLSHWVRDTGKIRMEDAIKRMTSDLASDLGLKQRGTLAADHFADIVIFDHETIGRGPQIAVDDVPGGGFRFVHRAIGVDRTIINGKIAIENDVYTEDRAGVIV